MGANLPFQAGSSSSPRGSVAAERRTVAGRKRAANGPQSASDRRSLGDRRAGRRARNDHRLPRNHPPAPSGTSDRGRRWNGKDDLVARGRSPRARAFVPSSRGRPGCGRGAAFLRRTRRPARGSPRRGPAAASRPTGPRAPRCPPARGRLRITTRAASHGCRLPRCASHSRPRLPGARSRRRHPVARSGVSRGSRLRGPTHSPGGGRPACGGKGYRAGRGAARAASATRLARIDSST